MDDHLLLQFMMTSCETSVRRAREKQYLKLFRTVCPRRRHEHLGSPPQTEQLEQRKPPAAYNAEDTNASETAECLPRSGRSESLLVFRHLRIVNQFASECFMLESSPFRVRQASDVYNERDVGSIRDVDSVRDIYLDFGF
jgi:hypothetical protein